MAWFEARLRPGEPGSEAATTVAGMRGGAVGTAARELHGYYCSLEVTYLEGSIEKAIAIDEAVPGALTTSMVDDCFYLLLKCSRRAGASQSAQCLCAVLSHVNELLCTDVKRAVQQRLRGATQQLVGSRDRDRDAAEEGQAAPASGEAAAAALNNADVSADYVQKLRREIEQSGLDRFTVAADRNRVRSCLSDLAKTAGDFRAVATSALEALASGIMPRLRSHLDAVTGVSYELFEEEYAAYEADDPWVQRLLATLDDSLFWLQPLLSPSNYESLVHLMLDAVVGRLEAVLTVKMFNQLGALQLDKDVRTCVAHAATLTEKAVREKFSRLSQMATILNLDSAGEILDYWGENSGSMTWRLNAQEVKQMLELRVEFERAEIALLALS